MLKDILSVSGQPGLFKLISQTKNSIIVESLTDGKRMPVYAASRISSLDDISIYTIDGDVKLSKILLRLFENKVDIDPKAAANILKDEFKKILPDYDSDRVYVSDIKKVFVWSRLLTEKGILSEENIKIYQESLKEEAAKEEKEK
ncbi:MAG: DUF5606 domain-containing protein [Cytophagaceae bacterium]|jgi:hypothetical protein|nr:DUF5606 domain-containing protein [Cytophagaceae bacterium]